MSERVLTIGDAPTGRISRIYMFDLDGTLITTKSGNRFPRSAQDWQWLYANTVDRLRAIAGPNTWIVIVSNQKLSSNVEKRQMVNNKLRSVYKALTVPGTPITFYAALASDRNRKPSTGIFEDCVYPHIHADVSTLIYVGDAAGREGDHADSDRKFAYNVHLFLRWAESPVRIKFYTPEEYFLREHVVTRPTWSGFNPRTYLDRGTPGAPGTPGTPGTLTVMVGAPASGKSTFARQIVEANPDVVYFGLDDMPRRRNYDNAFLSACENGVRSIVVDATNPDTEARVRWLRHADLFSHVYIYVLPSTSPQDRKRVAHMNVYRGRISGGEQIPEIAYRMFYKRYLTPSTQTRTTVINLPEPRMQFPSTRELMYFLQLS